MRTPLSIIFFLSWIVLGYLYWESNKECCVQVNSPTPLDSDITPEENDNQAFSLSFDINSPYPETGSKWNEIRREILDSLGDENNLEIKGIYFSSETNDSNSIDLGLARANAIRSLFSELPDNRIELTSYLNESTPSDSETEFYELNIKVNNEAIKEIENKTRIYFPFQSARRLTNERIETYLDDVAARVIQTGETVELIGHTDDISSKASNLKLGLKRANVIANYLLSKGVPSEQLSVLTKGEDEPLASNVTPEGRAENRRVELQIIK